MPRTKIDKTEKINVHAPIFNILFFGHFLAMEYDAFEKRLEEIIASDCEVYRTQMKDIYGMGSVLAEKYRFLKMSYLCFISGFVISILLVVLSYVFP